MNNTPNYRRVLLKLSGEALMGQGKFGIEPQVMTRIASEINDIVQMGVQLGIVIGGGNIFRGAGLTASGIERASADHIGMLATVINGLAMQDALAKKGVEAQVMSAIRIDTICEHYTRHRAISHLTHGRVIILVAGTGNPYFTTDTAASLRAIEIGAQLMIKATKVDGVYAADPLTDPTAKRYTRLNYNQVITRQLGVMDMTAIILCRDHQMPLRVIDMGQVSMLQSAVAGKEVGTLISNEEEQS